MYGILKIFFGGMKNSIHLCFCLPLSLILFDVQLLLTGRVFLLSSVTFKNVLSGSVILVYGIGLFPGLSHSYEFSYMH